MDLPEDVLQEQKEEAEHKAGTAKEEIHIPQLFESLYPLLYLLLLFLIN